MITHDGCPWQVALLGVPLMLGALGCPCWVPILGACIGCPIDHPCWVRLLGAPVGLLHRDAQMGAHPPCHVPPPTPPGPRCTVDINECASSPCLEGGTCLDGANGFTCLCPPGARDARCRPSTQPCRSSPCAHGTCHDHGDGWVPGLGLRGGLGLLKGA